MGRNQGEKSVSFIVPFYQHHSFISDCLKSLMNQTYKNFEIIVIDDGSTPRLVINSSSGIIFDRNEVNMGVSYTINKGIKVASGDYIVMFGADDIAEPLLLELSLEKIKETGRRWSTGGLIYIDNAGRELYRRSEVVDGLDDIKIRECIWGGCGLGTGSSVYEKSLFDEVGLLDERLRLHEDRDFCRRLILKKIFPAYVKGYLFRHREGTTVTRLQHIRGESDRLWENLKAVNL